MRLQKLIQITFFVSVLVSCDNTSSKIETILKSKLKDPDSLRVQSLIFNKPNNFACATWNAKNSFGGYSELHISSFIIKNEKWTIKKMEESARVCDPKFLAARDEYISLINEAKELYGLIKDLKISDEQKRETIKAFQPIINSALSDDLIEHLSFTDLEVLNEKYRAFLESSRPIREFL